MKNINTYINFILMLVLLGGCKEDLCYTEKEGNLAEDNDKIEDFRIFGDENEQYELNQGINSGDGNIYFTAFNGGNGSFIYEVVIGESGNVISSSTSVNGNDYEVGKMTTEGNRLWAKNNGFAVRNISLVEGISSHNNVLLVCGNNGIENQIGKGSFAFYSEHGDILNTIEVSSNNTWINSVSQIEGTNSFLCFGGVEENEIIYPFLCQLEIVDFDNISISNESVFYNFEERHFTSGVSNGLGFIVSIVSNSENYTKVEIASFDSNNSMQWSDLLAFEGDDNSYTYSRNNMFIENDQIYICGSSQDVDNEKIRGIVQSYDLNGNLNWEQKINPTKCTDGVFSILLNGNDLFLVGWQSAYRNDDDEISYSNGMLVKMNASNGTIQGEYTFKNDNKREGISLFGSIVKTGNSLNLLGITNYDFYASTTTINGWLIKLNYDDL